MRNKEQKSGLVLRKTSLRVLNDYELLAVAGGEDQTLTDWSQLSYAYTTRPTGAQPAPGNTIPTRYGRWETATATAETTESPTSTEKSDTTFGGTAIIFD